MGAFTDFPSFDLNGFQYAWGLVVLVLLYQWYKTLNNVPPGPYGLPVVGYLPFIGSDPSSKLMLLSKKYGDVFSLQLGKNLVVFLNDNESVKLVYSNPNSLDRAPVWGFQEYVGISGHSGDEWHEQKRFTLSCLRELSIGSTEWEKFIQEELELFVDKIESYEGRPIEIERDLKLFIINNVLTLLIGRTLGSSETDELIEYSEVSLTEGQITSFMTQMPWLINVLSLLGMYNYDKKTCVAERYLNIMRDQIKKHRQENDLKGVKDYINLYLEKMVQMEATNTKHYFNDTNLLGNLDSLFIGSVDTIYSSLIWLFRLMVKYPEVQQKAQKEIDELIADGQCICYEERKKFPCMMAVIMESMRYSSIVPLSTGRCAASDIKVKGFIIPKGTQMTAHLKALHFDPNYWEEPYIFNPNRFLRDNGKTYESNPESFAPFSYGRRMCPGDRISWMELINFFSVIIHRFTIKLSEGETARFDVVDGLLETLLPQNLIFEKRLHNK